MNFGWFESLLLGMTTGLTDVLPVSAQAHNRILIQFMGTAPGGRESGHEKAKCRKNHRMAGE